MAPMHLLARRQLMFERPITQQIGANTLRQATIAIVAIALTGCAVGPDYRRPTLPASNDFSPVPLPSQTSSASVEGGAAQHFAIEAVIRADWWTMFGSLALNALIEKSFAANPTIESAQAALRVAQENVYAQQGFFFPTIQAGYKVSRTKLAGNLGGNSPGIQGDGSVISTKQGKPASEGGVAPFNAPVIYNFHTAQLTVGFVPDVFGANRRQVEAMRAQASSERFQLEAAFVTLASNIVAAAIQDALLRRQIALAKEMVDASQHAVDLTHRQLREGYASRLDLANQESALAQARTVLPPLVKQFEQNRDLLRALSGATQDAEVPDFDLRLLHLPEELPLSLPSRLVEQRPDVRAAEAQLQAASAQVGIARAARLPQFAMNADVGGAARNLSQMFWNSGRFFDLALTITQPIFDGGTLRHRERAAEQGLVQAAAQYRQVVITAFQNVADTLRAIHADAQALQANAEALDAAKTALELTQRQHAGGYVDRLSLIVAEQAHRQAQLNLAQAQAGRLGDSAALFQALGGGWWHRAEDETVGVTAVVP